MEDNITQYFSNFEIELQEKIIAFGMAKHFEEGDIMIKT